MIGEPGRTSRRVRPSGTEPASARTRASSGLGTLRAHTAAGAELPDSVLVLASALKEERITPKTTAISEGMPVGSVLARRQPFHCVLSCYLAVGRCLLGLRRRRSLAGCWVLVELVEHRRRGQCPSPETSLRRSAPAGAVLPNGAVPPATGDPLPPGASLEGDLDRSEGQGWYVEACLNTPRS